MTTKEWVEELHNLIQHPSMYKTAPNFVRRIQKDARGKIKIALEAKAEFCDALGDSQRKVAALEKELSAFRQAVGLANTISRNVVMDPNNPVSMVLEIIKENEDRSKSLWAVVDAAREIRCPSGSSLYATAWDRYWKLQNTIDALDHAGGKNDGTGNRKDWPGDS